MGSAKNRGEGQYTPLPYAQLKSPAWRSLSGAAVKVWLELHTRFNGGNNGKLTLSYAEAGEALEWVTLLSKIGPCAACTALVVVRHTGKRIRTIVTV